MSRSENYKIKFPARASREWQVSSQHSVVGIAASLRVGRSGVRIPVGGERFVSSLKR